MENQKEKVRVAMIMRMGRAALGMSQQEFADALGVAKSTVARNETLEMAMRADTLTAMLRILNDHGIETNLLTSKDDLVFTISESFLERKAVKSTTR